MALKKQVTLNPEIYRHHWRWSAKIVSRKVVAEKSYELQLAIADPLFSYQPGQYVWLLLPKLRYQDQAGSRREFSITNAPNANGRITLLIRDSESGFHRSLRELPLKSTVECLGPFGMAFTIPRSSPDLVLIAGGMGVAPFLSLIRSATSINGPQLTLLWYNTTAERAPYLDELHRLAKSSRRIAIRHFTRRFELADVGARDRQRRWYVSGPQGLIDTVAQAAKTHGLDRSQLRFEQHYPQNPGSIDLARQLADIRRHTEINPTSDRLPATLEADVIGKVLPTALLVGALISLLIGLVYILNGQMATVNLLVAIFLMIIRVGWGRPARRPAIKKLTLIIIFGVMAWVALSGGTENYGILWVGIFPLFALWLQPQTGHWWALSFILLIFGFSLVNSVGIWHLAYSGEVYFQSGMFLILTSSITRIFLSGNLKLQKELTNTISQESIFHRAIANSVNHVIITDSNANILYANPASQRITGFTWAEMAGHTPRLWGGLMSEKYYQQLWKINLSGQPVTSEVTNHRKNHEIYTAIAHISPIIHPQHGITGYVATEEDISVRKKYESHLSHLTTRFELATSSAKIGVWDWDIVNDVLLWDDLMYELYGIRKKDFSGVYRAWQNGIYLPDRKQSDEAIKQALQGRKEFNTDFRVRWPNGEIHWIRAMGEVERDRAGRPIKMVGVNWDITKEKEVDQAKSEFVSLASHQLRTPLTSINWYTEMLLNGDAGKLSSAQRKFVQEVSFGSQRMTAMVNTLLNVARIEAGTFSVSPELVSLQEIIAMVVQENNPRVIEQHLVIKRQIDDTLPPVSVDRQLIYIILQNLITNAIKYTPAKGQITVGYARHGKHLILTVRDTGYGIPTSQQGKIFQKLYRADNVRTKVTDGTGLGLYIVKSILDHTGGTISFTSAEDKGTTFTVTLPATGMIARVGTKQLNPATTNPIKT